MSSTTTHTKAIEKECECAICLDLLSGVPRNLDCQHTFCHGCLEKLAKQCKKTPLRLTCPLCKKVTIARKGVAGLPANRPLAAIAARLRQGGSADADAAAAAMAQQLSEEAEMKKFLVADHTVVEHYHAQKAYYGHYCGVLLLLLETKVELLAATKARVLAAAWARRDFELAELLLKKPESFHLPEVLRACQILDGARQMRQFARRLDKLRAQNARAAKLSAVKTEMNNIEQNGMVGTLSGALRKRIKQWVKSIDGAELEYYLLNFPREPWQKLANMLHLGAADFQRSWFLACAFGAEPPEIKGSLMWAVMRLSKENAVETLKAYSVPYTAVRKKLTATELSDEAKALIAGYETLEQLIWWYEELHCRRVDEVIGKRLAGGEEPRLSYGKLVERVMTMKQRKAPFLQYLLPIAERRMKDISLSLEQPVAVMGDASSSMGVAVRTATIIGGLLSAMCTGDGCELTFFNSGLYKSPKQPRSVADVLDVADQVKASGCTANVAALADYLRRKVVVKTIIQVTDEEENTSVDGMRFMQCYKRYRDEVFPAKLVFVSFLRPNDKGQMCKQLDAEGIEYEQFRFDTSRPDLTKLDGMLGQLAAQTSNFNDQVNALAKQLETGGVKDVASGDAVKRALKASGDAAVQNDGDGSAATSTSTSASGTAQSWASVAAKPAAASAHTSVLGAMKKLVGELNTLALSAEPDARKFVVNLSKIRHLVQQREFDSKASLRDEVATLLSSFTALLASGAKQATSDLHNETIVQTEVWSLRLAKST